MIILISNSVKSVSFFKRKEEFYKNTRSKDGLTYWCKDCENKRYKDYYNKNKDKILRRSRKNNKDYYKRYKKEINERHKLYNNSGAKYEVYFNKLTIDEMPRISEDGISLEVKCRYCGKYFIPNNRSIINRIVAISDINHGEGSLYCSDGCKEACPIYNQEIHIKGYSQATSREVNPLIRQMCFERDNWGCQKCGATNKESQLHCHHVKGYTQNKILGNDIDNVITLCKECHKDVHSARGCKYSDLKCDKIK